MTLALYKSRLLIFAVFLSVWALPTLAQNSLPNLGESSANCLAKKRLPYASQFSLEVDCPEIYTLLQVKGLVATLETPLPAQLSAVQLRILLSATQFVDNARLLDESRLDALLAKIYTIKQEESSFGWWEQFLDWLKSFETKKNEPEFSWLADFLSAIALSEESALIILYGAIGLLLLLSLVFIFNELHLAGLFSRKRRKDRKNKQAALGANDNAQTCLSIAEIKQLTPSLQAITLLKRVINHLMANESLPQNTALSNLELKQYLQQENATSAQPFFKLVANVEPVLYGNITPSDAVLEHCWQQAEQILNP